MLRGGTIETVAPIGELGEPPRDLRWERVPGARSYRIRIETVAGDVLWEAEVDGDDAGTDMTTRMELPREARAKMSRAVTYRWTVQALDERGGVLARSEPAAFRAAPEAEPEPPPGAPPGDDGDPQP